MSFEMPERYALNQLLAAGPLQGRQLIRAHALDEVLRNPQLLQCELGNLNLVGSRIVGGCLLHCRISAADLLGTTFENTVLVNVVFDGLRASHLTFQHCYFETPQIRLLESMSGSHQILFDGCVFRQTPAVFFKGLQQAGATFQGCLWEASEGAEVPEGIKVLLKRDEPTKKEMKSVAAAPAPLAVPLAEVAPTSTPAAPNRFDTIEWKKEGTT